MAMTALRIDELRKSLASFETVLSDIGEQLSTQMTEQGSKQDQRMQVVSGQVQHMQAAQTATREWVETRTKAIEEKQTADGIATVAQLEKLRGSLAGFEDAIVRLGEGVAVQISEQEAQRESLATQMRAAQMAIQSWVEASTAELIEHQERLETVFAERDTQISKNTLETANQDKWIQSVSTRLGQARSSQFEMEKQVAGVLEAVGKMEAQGVATMTHVNELTRLIDRLTARVGQGATGGGQGNE